MPSLKRAIPLAVCLAGAVCAASPASAAGHRIRFFAPHADGTTLVAMNSLAAAIGNWYKSSPPYNGAYLRAPDGTFTNIRYPDALSTHVFGINASGAIVGFYYIDPTQRGFVRDSEGGFLSFDLPGDGARFFAQTYINDSGTVAGSYLDAVGTAHGFVRNTDGSVVGFDAPGGSSTTVAGIDGSGNVAGIYSDTTSEHGFLRSAEGIFSTIDVPGAGDTVIFAMNANGDMAGNYSKPGTRQWSHAFFRDANGVVTVFNGTKGALPVPTGVDDDGNVTGTYVTRHGYWGFKYTVGDKVRPFHFCHMGCRTLPNAIGGGVVGGTFELWHGDHLMKSKAFLRF